MYTKQRPLELTVDFADKTIEGYINLEGKVAKRSLKDQDYSLKIGDYVLLVDKDSQVSLLHVVIRMNGALAADVCD